jgi:hypothetical protein
MYLFHKNDGASATVQSILPLIRDQLENEISWCDHDSYRMPQCHRYHNCREQGYTLIFKRNIGELEPNLNIVIYQHRNSDQICLIVWEHTHHYPPTQASLIAEGIFEKKSDYTAIFEYNEGDAVARYVTHRVSEYYAQKDSENE